MKNKLKQPNALGKIFLLSALTTIVLGLGCVSYRLQCTFEMARGDQWQIRNDTSWTIYARSGAGSVPIYPEQRVALESGGSNELLINNDSGLWPFYSDARRVSVHEPFKGGELILREDEFVCDDCEPEVDLSQCRFCDRCNIGCTR